MRDFFSAQGLRRAIPTSGPRSSRASPCSTTWKTRPLRARRGRAALGGWRLGHGAPLPALDARANSFDAIVHEHLEYYSLAVIERLLTEAGLEVIRAELNDMNGGSIRLFISHAGRRERTDRGAGRLQDLRVREFELALDSPAPYERFARDWSGSGTSSAALRNAHRRGQDDSRLWRLDQGEHHPSVRRPRSVGHPLRRRPQPGQVGLGDDLDADPDHQRGGVASDGAPSTTSFSLALPGRVRQPGGGISRGAAGGSSCPCQR